MAASSTNTLVLTVVATAALTQFRGVNIAGALPGAALTTLGFAQQSAAIGESTPVVVLGTAIAEAGAAIAAGALLEVNAAGQVITRSAGITVGRALTAAGAIGDQVEAFLFPN